jgi:4'-phosphopantetheinyl transferase
VPQLPLPTDAVHLWRLRPEQASGTDLLDRYERLLSADERDRMRRFVRAEDAHLYLVSHAMLRLTLSRYVDAPPEAWQFEANEYGRPQIAAPECGKELQFNLSHTRGLAACGVRWRESIGVDVENSGRPNSGADVAAHFFSPQEVADLRAAPLAERAGRFFDFWTLKEAYLKARGVGLSLPLADFSIHLGGSGPPLGGVAPISISFAPQLDDDPAWWQFALLHPTPQHALAVAIRRPPGQSCRVLCREAPLW